MVQIHNIYVGQGDCFLIVIEEESWIVSKEEREKTKKYFTILVDGGFAKDNIYIKVKELLAGKDLNVIIVTHVDRDHISGIIKFINMTELNLEKTVVLFNKFDEEIISYRDGEELFKKILEKGNEKLLFKSYSEDFIEENKKVQWDVDKNLECKFFSINQRKLNRKIDEKSVYITVLGPKFSTVKKFMQNWNDDKSDPIITNKSSIVTLIEFNKYKILMLGDAYLSDVKHCMNELDGKIQKIDLIKVSHHGAEKNNVGLWEFAKKYNCKKFIITIDANQENEKDHPNRELINNMPIDYNISCGKTIECHEIEIIQHKDKVELFDEKLS